MFHATVRAAGRARHASPLQGFGVGAGHARPRPLPAHRAEKFPVAAGLA
jgi:hypothetical protein